MEVLVVVVGLFVALGTPGLTYLAARKGHAATERVARIAADAARDAANAAATAAALATETSRAEHDRNHFRWACEQAFSEQPATRAGGIAILKSMFTDESMGHAELVAVAGVLDSLTASAVGRATEELVDELVETALKGDPEESDGGKAGAA